ncbi:MAG TPA: hypothetical protein PKD86_00825 [Gemmatales bacterium]|nr:hypothetical protein [Gemmatales bacterium]
MASRLVEELRSHGYQADPEAFRETLADVMFNGYGSWTIDDLLCHPEDALEYCRMVRQLTGSDLPDDLILKTLLNLRKRGY